MLFFSPECKAACVENSMSRKSALPRRASTTRKQHCSLFGLLVWEKGISSLQAHGFPRGRICHSTGTKPPNTNNAVDLNIEWSRASLLNSHRGPTRCDATCVRHLNFQESFKWPPSARKPTVHKAETPSATRKCFGGPLHGEEQMRETGSATNKHQKCRTHLQTTQTRQAN